MTLEPNDYWKLRAVNSDLERDQAALMAIQARLGQSQARRQQVWQEITTKYELDTTVQYAMKDDDCSMTPTTGNGSSAVG